MRPVSLASLPTQMPEIRRRRMAPASGILYTGTYTYRFTLDAHKSVAYGSHMAATENTRIPFETKRLVEALAADLRIPQTEVLARAVEQFNRHQFLKRFEESVAALSAEELAEEKAQAAEWDTTLMDGLENE